MCLVVDYSPVVFVVLWLWLVPCADLALQKAVAEVPAQPSGPSAVRSSLLTPAACLLTHIRTSRPTPSSNVQGPQSSCPRICISFSTTTYFVVVILMRGHYKRAPTTRDHRRTARRITTRDRTVGLGQRPARPGGRPGVPGAAPLPALYGEAAAVVSKSLHYSGAGAVMPTAVRS